MLAKLTSLIGAIFEFIFEELGIWQRTRFLKDEWKKPKDA
jgi:hypothetical protein